MLIREATSADAPTIAAIRGRAIRRVVAPLGLYTPEEIEAWASDYSAGRVAEFIGQGNFLVAEDQGRVVGYGRLRLESQGVASVRGVFVDADFVGRGIGGAILDRLLAIGAGLNITTFELVATLNARAFYERRGFVCLERVRHATPNGAVIPGYRMRLETKCF